MSYETWNPLQKNAQKHLNARTRPTNPCIMTTRSSIELIREAIAGREAATSDVFYERTCGKPIKYRYINSPATSMNSKKGNKSRVFPSNYISFPRFHTTRISSPAIAKHCAQKLNSCLATAGSKLLTSFIAIGDFYANSEQKWSSEYRPYDLTPTESEMWYPAPVPGCDKLEEPVAAPKTDKSKKSSYCKKLQTYWKPKPMQFPGDNIHVGHSISWETWNATRWEDEEAWRLCEDPNYHRELKESCFYAPEFEFPYCGHTVDEDDMERAWEDAETHRMGGNADYCRDLVNSGDYRLEFEYPYYDDADDESECGSQCDGLEASGEMCYRHGNCAREGMAAQGI